MLARSFSEYVSFDTRYRVIEVDDNKIIARIPDVKIGECMMIVDDNHSETMKCEVIKIEDNDRVVILPYKQVTNLSRQYYVKKILHESQIEVGHFLRGSILDGFGQQIGSFLEEKDNVVRISDYVDSSALMVPDPMTRKIIDQQFITGVRALDVVTPCGIGQKMLVCAQAGVGKTTLINMIAQRATGTVIINLIGERGREVREMFDSMTESVKQNAVFIVTTSDKSNAEKVKSLYTAHAIASWFRSKGEDVLLIVDSLTRFARALREISQASGSIMVRGYTSAVFNCLPSILEVCGKDDVGSITSFYTALFEGDSIQNDPLIEEVKSITDGHIVLARKVASSGRYPAVDFLNSISRIFHQITTDEHKSIIQQLLDIYNRYAEIEIMIKIGEYKPGANDELDKLVTQFNKANKFFTQNNSEDYANVGQLLSIAKRTILDLL